MRSVAFLLVFFSARPYSNKIKGALELELIVFLENINGNCILIPYLKF